MTVKSVVLHFLPVPLNIIKGCSLNSRCQPSSCILAVLARFSGSSSAISSLRNVLNVLQFFLSTKPMQPHPQGLSVDVPFSRGYFLLLTSFFKCPKSIPNLVELVMKNFPSVFEPISYRETYFLQHFLEKKNAYLNPLPQYF